MTMPSSKNLKLNWLRTFEAVGVHSSMSAAAAHLHMSQGAVSLQIGLLEQKLGKKLFMRRGRSLELSATGRAYLTVVQKGLEHIERGMASIFSSECSRVLELSVNNSFAQLWLAPRIQRFLAHCSRLDLRIYGTNWEEGQPPGASELEIRYGHGNWPEFEAKAILCGGLRPWCARGALGMVGDDVGFDHVVLIEVLGTPVGWTEWLAMALPRLKFSGRRVYVDSYATATALATSGVGVCLINDELIRASRLHETLVPAHQLRVEDQANFYVLQPRGRRRSAGADAFIEWVSLERAAAEARM
jgi:LysR family glycine cleavage system transcriptional activator